MSEEFQDFSTVMYVIEMENGLRDPNYDLVIAVVQFFDFGGLAFRQMHDVVRRVQGSVVVSFVES